ncbi:hypothetical protein B0H14DRAFT_2640718 [Mycena olivaceomarginata]|nr:hypothetical protein B0H14DRAFT_2640718 [Mycena olivaceomarginata]
MISCHAAGPQEAGDDDSDGESDLTDLESDNDATPAPPLTQPGPRLSRTSAGRKTTALRPERPTLHAARARWEQPPPPNSTPTTCAVNVHTLLSSGPSHVRGCSQDEAPTGFVHNVIHTIVLTGLLAQKPFQRLAGFTNGIFRFVDNGFRNDVSVNESGLTAAEQQEQIEARRTRWVEGLKMYLRWEFTYE